MTQQRQRRFHYLAKQSIQNMAISNEGSSEPLPDESHSTADGKQEEHEPPISQQSIQQEGSQKEGKQQESAHEGEQQENEHEGEQHEDVSEADESIEEGEEKTEESSEDSTQDSVLEFDSMGITPGT